MPLSAERCCSGVILLLRSWEAVCMLGRRVEEKGLRVVQGGSFM